MSCTRGIHRVRRPVAKRWRTESQGKGETAVSNDKLEKARELIQQAALEQLYFDRCSAERSVIGQAPRQFKVDFEFGGTGRTTSPSTFEVIAVFKLTASGEDGAAVANMKCDMVLKYRVEPGVVLADEAVSAFAETNGVFNAWPYFREYVQSAVQRLGLGITITLPLLRVKDLVAMRSKEDTAKGADISKRRA